MLGRRSARPPAQLCHPANKQYTIPQPGCLVPLTCRVGGVPAVQVGGRHLQPTHLLSTQLHLWYGAKQAQTASSVCVAVRLKASGHKHSCLSTNICARDPAAPALLACTSWLRQAAPIACQQQALVECNLTKPHRLHVHGGRSGQQDGIAREQAIQGVPHAGDQARGQQACRGGMGGETGNGVGSRVQHFSSAQPIQVHSAACSMQQPPMCSSSSRNGAIRKLQQQNGHVLCC